MSRKAYRFPTKKASKAPTFSLPVSEKTTQEEVMGLIQGQIPDSKEEWWTALWLAQKKKKFTYQYPVFGGGRTGRGGYRIDFVIETDPLWDLLELYGGYWHEGAMSVDDRARERDIEEFMEDIANIPIKKIMADDMIDRETLIAALERRIK